MLHRESIALAKQLDKEFRTLPFDPVQQRHDRIREICLAYGTPLHLEHGFNIPEPEASHILLGRAAANFDAMAWLSERIAFDELRGCWDLPLDREHDEKGRARYPQLSNHNINAKNELAHRFVIRRMFGAIATEQYLDHICRSHACCNPTHLEIVSHTTNTRRGAKARESTTGQLPLY
jgi:hypothetical protein